MLTPKMSGLFDVRDYDGKTKEHQLRRMKADTDNIVFSVLYQKSELPECFKVNGQPDELLKERASKKERNAAEAEGRQQNLDSFAVTFKIGANCKWFDKYAKPCDRPTNAELEAGSWSAQIDFVRREKDPANLLKPSGYWVNCIMIAKVENNPFEGQAFEVVEEPEPQTIEEADAALPFD